MAHFGITIPDEIYNLLLEEKARTGATLSLLIRRYIERGMTEDGVDLSHVERVSWGGARPATRKPDDGETTD